MQPELEIIPTKCSVCFGNGKVHDAVCGKCKGQGKYKNPRNHPLCGSDEVFVGNQQGAEPCNYLRGLKTMRLVQPAFDIDANRLKESENCWAVIMNQSDASEYNRIMERRLSEIRAGIKRST